MPDISTQLRDYLEGTTTPVAAREIIMGTEFKEVEAAPQPGIRWGTLASVAALVAVVVGVVWALSPRGGFAPAADPVHPDVAVVEAAIEAFNDGDVEALENLLVGEEDDVYGWVFGPTGMVEAKMAANQVITIERCAPAPNTGYVNCELTETNDHFGPAGLLRTGSLTARIEGGGLASASFATASNDPIVAYGNAMLTWLGETYPDVYAGLPVYVGEEPGGHPMSFSTSGVPIAEAMPTVLDYVDEFVEQSDEYGIDP